MRRSGTSRAADQQAAVERALIDEFLRKIGHTHCTIERLPADQQRTLLRAASAFAALKVAEMEMAARLGHHVSLRAGRW